AEAWLFGAGGPAWGATARPEAVPAVQELARRGEPAVPVHVIGRVTPGRVRIAVAGQGIALDEPIDALRIPWERALQEAARP
ncbi:MAG: hypothetical protein GX496_04695, partial [Firmicutes bacterium]|nr:hypothetical protein [Bacillota bacterium]